MQISSSRRGVQNDGTTSSKLPADLNAIFLILAYGTLHRSRSYPLERTPSKVPLLPRELYLLIKTSKAFYARLPTNTYVHTFQVMLGCLSLELTKQARTTRKWLETQWSLFVLKLTQFIVAGRGNQKRIHVPKRGDWSLSWNCYRIKWRRPNFASCCPTVLLVDQSYSKRAKPKIPVVPVCHPVKHDIKKERLTWCLSGSMSLRIYGIHYMPT